MNQTESTCYDGCILQVADVASKHSAQCMLVNEARVTHNFIFSKYSSISIPSIYSKMALNPTID